MNNRFKLIMYDIMVNNWPELMLYSVMTTLLVVAIYFESL
jgi:hypothetical protein